MPIDISRECMKSENNVKPRAACSRDNQLTEMILGKSPFLIEVVKLKLNLSYGLVKA